ncbi:hypothetical protein BC940DRAFT_313308 [Gongronella butleri]|nr:hypothetical protein BC940DRAFT_313308 [Gongronella butleri]
MKNPYQVLGVGRYATKKQIKQRYVQLCKQHHPDLAARQAHGTSGGTQGGASDITEIIQAYEQLTKHRHTVMEPRQSPFYQHNETNTKKHTQYSLLAGLALMVSVVAYITYEPTPDPQLAHMDQLPPANASAANLRSWRRKKAD